MRYPDRLDRAPGDARSVDEVLGVLSKDQKVRQAIKLSINQAAVAEQERINNPHIVGSGAGSRVTPEGEPQPAVFGAALHDALIENLPVAIKYDGQPE